MMVSRVRALAAAALVAAALLGALGVRSLGAGREARDPGSAAAPSTAPAAAATGLLRHGDCGIHVGGSVTPALCDDRAADVEVARVHLGGDPGMLCPLFRPNAVLSTPITEDLFACWVPRGGGPRRSFEGPAPVVPVVTVATVDAGACGLIHDDHVHHPLDCHDPTVNAVAVEVLASGDPTACPAQTDREEILADGARICWSATEPGSAARA
jgi:hypothetical protein